MLVLPRLRGFNDIFCNCIYKPSFSLEGKRPNHNAWCRYRQYFKIALFGLEKEETNYLAHVIAETDFMLISFFFFTYISQGVGLTVQD